MMAAAAKRAGSIPKMLAKRVEVESETVLLGRSPRSIAEISL